MRSSSLLFVASVALLVLGSLAIRVEQSGSSRSAAAAPASVSAAPSASAGSASAVQAPPLQAEDTSSTDEGDQPEESAASGDGKMDSRGKNKVYTDKQGHHYIFLTNKNTLVQNMPTSGSAAVRTQSAALMAKHLIRLAKRKAAAKLKRAELEAALAIKAKKDADQLKAKSTEVNGAIKAQSDKEKAALAENLKVELASGWEQYGSDYQALSASRDGDLCILQGVVRGTAGQVATLGPACRPADGRLIFSTLRTDLQTRVDILADGRVYVIAGGADGWLTLSGITFTVAIKDNIELLNNWVAFGEGYRPVSITKQGNLCVVSGLIRSGNWQQPFARVPTECYPSDRLIFNANNHALPTRVDVTKTGHIIYAGGRSDHGWISLDGIVYSPAVGGINLDLKNRWKHFGQEYRVARYIRVGDMCVLSGLIKNDDDWSETIATLVPACRPAARQIFTVSVHSNSARVDVLANGDVVYVRGKAAFAWLPLDGIRFIAAPPKNTA